MFATVKDPDNVPPEIEQFGELTETPEREHDESARENPEPDT